MLKKITPDTYGEDIASSSPEEYYPSFSLSTKNLADIKDWEVDKDYYLVMKVTQKSKSMFIKDKKEVWDASFDIKEVGIAEGKKEEKEDNPLKDLY